MKNSLTVTTLYSVFLKKALFQCSQVVKVLQF